MVRRIERHEPRKPVERAEPSPTQSKAMRGPPQHVIKVAEEVSPVGEERIRSLGKVFAKHPQGLAKGYDISYPSTVK